MIYDFATEVTATAPTSSASVSYSNAIDLTDGNDGVPALFGAGYQLYMQFEVTVAFAAASGAPLAQFGVVIDDTSTIADGSAIVLGMTGGSVATKVGYEHSELTVGKKFHLAIPPFDDVMENTAGAFPNTKNASTLDAFRAMKHMGILICNPMAVGSNAFSAGTVKARIVTNASLGTAINAYQYPSRSKIL